MSAEFLSHFVWFLKCAYVNELGFILTSRQEPTCSVPGRTFPSSIADGPHGPPSRHVCYPMHR